MQTPRFPAEWEPQSAVILVWPHPDSDWRELLASAERCYQEIARAIIARQGLLVVCHNEAIRQRVAALLADAEGAEERLRLAVAPSNDTWIRDFGPLTVLHGERAELLDFRFNAWGGKFAAELDDQLCAKLAEQGVFPTPMQRSSLVLEGGAVECDGAGTLLATRHSVVTSSRNQGVSEAEIEAQLHALLGIERFLWLDHGQLRGDDTDGHIDTLARFCDPQTLLHVTTAPDDPDHPEISAMIAELATLRSATGTPLQLRPLPPAPQIHSASDQRRLAASYANFLIINGAVLLPIYRHPHDAEAIAVVADCFPERQVIPIDCRPLIEQNGSLHCITMQLPDKPSTQSLAPRA